MCGAVERSDASPVSTASDSVDLNAHNIWNPVLELLFHVQVGGVFEIFVEEMHLPRIALSCHFYKAVTHDSVFKAFLGTIALGVNLFWYGTTATLALCPSGFKEADTTLDTTPNAKYAGRRQYLLSS